ncbi:hypothetical protein F4778DRAFT_739284 [Xylariomycetidae sp. FL2044]|nr:hypothetical protein F4778DRAFT_739284 [Xylariomycetidae sp. FL2044]
MAPATKYALIPILLGLSVFGFNATVGTLSKNGFGDVITDLTTGRLAFLPGAPQPFKRSYTGLAPLDGLLATLVAFWIPLVDGDVGGDVRLFYIWAAGQFASSWTLLVLEGLRVGNRRRLAGLVTVAGLLMQVATLTAVAPLYAVLHLLTSPTASLRNGDGDAARRTLFVYLWDMALLPMAVTLSFVVPGVFMSMPHLFNQSADTHYSWLALWQFFPLWTILALKTLHWSCYLALGSLSPADEDGAPTTPGRAYMVGVSGVYEFALTLCGVTTLPVLALTLAPEPARSTLGVMWPATLAPLLERATFSRTFLPAVASSWVSGAPTTTVVVPSSSAVVVSSGDLAPLAADFLRWDMYVGHLALLLWSVYLHQNTVRNPSLVAMLRKVAFWFVVGGPSAACLALHWDRDDVVREGDAEVVVPVKKTN